MNLRLLVAVLALVACSPAHQAQMPEHTNASAALERKTVALVTNGEHGLRAYCSGVWVGPEKILTANHCVEDRDRVAYVTREDLFASGADEVEAVHFGDVAARDEAHDLAVLHVHLAPGHDVADVVLPIVGQNVQSMGHPLGLWWSYSTGQVSAIRMVDFNEDSGAAWYVQSTAPISPGNSGGGLFDEDGNLLGICHAYMPRGENVNFYIHAQYIRSFLARGK